MDERNLQANVLKMSRGPHRLFRNNVGAYPLPSGKYLHYGLCNGSSDVIGWTQVTITADMVGRTVAVFTALETKGKRRRYQKGQREFVRAVREAGGISGVVDNEEEAAAVLEAGSNMNPGPVRTAP